MQYTSFLALAVLVGSCYAQDSAQEAVESIDSITQAIVEVESLVRGAPTDDLAEAEQAIMKHYRDLIVAEGSFNDNNVSPEIKSKATEEEKEQICVSQNESIDKHILLLDALVAKYDAFSTSFYAVGTALLRQDEQSSDIMAVTLVDIAPDCKQKNVQDFADKFQAAIEKYDTSA